MIILIDPWLGSVTPIPRLHPVTLPPTPLGFVLLHWPLELCHVALNPQRGSQCSISVRLASDSIQLNLLEVSPHYTVPFISILLWIWPQVSFCYMDLRFHSVTDTKFCYTDPSFQSATLAVASVLSHWPQVSFCDRDEVQFLLHWPHFPFCHSDIRFVPVIDTKFSFVKLSSGCFLSLTLCRDVSHWPQVPLYHTSLWSHSVTDTTFSSVTLTPGFFLLY